MAKITRQNLRQFGSTPGSQQMVQFGSVKEGSPVYTTDVETIQALDNWLVGWYDAIIAGSYPTVQDMNALLYVLCYQLTYVLQSGIAEWDDATTYYIGSLVTDSSGNTYRSLADNNLNNAVTDLTKWALYSSQDVIAINPTTTPTYTLTAADNRKTFDVNSANGVCAFSSFSSPAKNFTFWVKDVGGQFFLNPSTFAPNGAQTIEGLNSTFSLKKNYGMWKFFYDGTNWWLS